MSEGFLARWARRKREAVEETRGAAEPDAAERTASAERGRPLPAAPAETAENKEKGAPVDLAKLPSIDSITAETDIRAFLGAGVPAELTRAALRRAWASDPAIRDFVGIAENQWDFTAPGGAPGFGPLEATSEEIRRLVARIIGDTPAADAGDRPPASENKDIPAESVPVPSTAQVETAALAAAPEEPSIETQGIVREGGDCDAAPQHDAPAATFPKPRGGGALPR